jgi:hypothetical protein
MKRFANRTVAILMFGLLFVSAFVITDKIYPSDARKSKKKLVFIENNAKFGEERPIIFNKEDDQDSQLGGLVSPLLYSINPNPGPVPPDTTGGH